MHALTPGITGSSPIGLGRPQNSASACLLASGITRHHYLVVRVVWGWLVSPLGACVGDNDVIYICSRDALRWCSYIAVLHCCVMVPWRQTWRVRRFSGDTKYSKRSGPQLINDDASRVTSDATPPRPETSKFQHHPVLHHGHRFVPQCPTTFPASFKHSYLMIGTVEGWWASWWGPYACNNDVMAYAARGENW